MGSRLAQLRQAPWVLCPQELVTGGQGSKSLENSGAGNMQIATSLGVISQEKGPKGYCQTKPRAQERFSSAHILSAEGSPPLLSRLIPSSAPPAAWPAFLCLKPAVGSYLRVLAGTTFLSLCESMVWTWEPLPDSSPLREAQDLEYQSFRDGFKMEPLSTPAADKPEAPSGGGGGGGGSQQRPHGQ